MSDEKKSKEIGLPKEGDHEGWGKKLDETLSLGERASALVPGTVKKLDMALSSGVEGFFYAMGGDKLQIWNARRRLATQRNAHKLLEEYNRMDDDDITLAPMEVEVPLLEKLTSTDDEKLSGILIKLLIAASSKKNGHLVHPSMVTVAENLSPDEAAILNSFENTVEGYPMINVKYIDQRPEMKGAEMTGLKYFSRLNEFSGLVRPYLVRPYIFDFYIENMISQGLFECYQGYLPVAGKAGHSPHPDYEILKRKGQDVFKPAGPDDYVFASDNFILKPTDKGKMFISIIKNIDLAAPETTATG